LIFQATKLAWHKEENFLKREINLQIQTTVQAKLEYAQAQEDRQTFMHKYTKLKKKILRKR